MINLKHLDLSFCETIFDFSPIKNLTKLVYLDLTDCKIEDLELSDLNNLKTEIKWMQIFMEHTKLSN